MDKRTAKALEGSIEKWQKIVDFLKWKREVHFSRAFWRKLHSLEQGASNCPLCQLFSENGCANWRAGAFRYCPVIGQDKGGRGCTFTPYGRFTTATHDLNLTAMKKQAKAELEFLKSLREDAA